MVRYIAIEQFLAESVLPENLVAESPVYVQKTAERLANFLIEHKIPDEIHWYDYYEYPKLEKLVRDDFHRLNAEERDDADHRFNEIQERILIDLKAHQQRQEEVGAIMMEIAAIFTGAISIFPLPRYANGFSYDEKKGTNLSESIDDLIYLLIKAYFADRRKIVVPLIAENFADAGPELAIEVAKFY